tara:strand:- start:177 stop:662 length:486 start_codon:yes stop_codon:yes gene_type:complete
MLKKQHTIYKLLFKGIILFNIIINLSFAEDIKPNTTIEPKKVIKIQLSALMKNDNPYKDHGIIQTWYFAHPNNKKITGPIERFKNMLKTESYSMLINHTEHNIQEVFKSSKVATFEVTVLDSEKKYYKFKWQVEKYNLEGPLKDCWLTTAVSQPIPLGSSV